MADWTIRQGVTDPVTFALQEVDENGNVSAADLTGMTKADLRISSTDGQITKNFDTTSGKLAFLDPRTGGQVKLSPDANDFALPKKSYVFFFLVTDGAGNEISFPHDRNLTLEVLPTF